MITVGAFEAKTHLPALLERVANGERFTITRHGVPVATLVPVSPSRTKKPTELVQEMRRLRESNRLKGLSIRQLIDEGRRF
ncbi:MAG: type II toxin-antitoxin system prevent-host-death family antitoxin [Acidobacteria bacterium]|nr:type II toxin-antitoxin system prevent-host-death family antitoxin [Acidobacteriota bacterium]